MKQEHQLGNFMQHYLEQDIVQNIALCRSTTFLALTTRIVLELFYIVTGWMFGEQTGSSVLFISGEFFFLQASHP